MEAAQSAALRIQCAVRRKLAVHKASNILKLVVRTKWGPSELGTMRIVLDTTRPEFPIALIAAEYPMIGSGHVVLPLSQLLDAAKNNKMPGREGRAQARTRELVRNKIAGNDLILGLSEGKFGETDNSGPGSYQHSEDMTNELVESMRFAFLRAAEKVPGMVYLAPPEVRLLPQDVAQEEMLCATRNIAATRIQSVQRSYAAKARVAVLRWRERLGLTPTSKARVKPLGDIPGRSVGLDSHFTFDTLTLSFEPDPIECLSAESELGVLASIEGLSGVDERATKIQSLVRQKQARNRVAFQREKMKLKERLRIESLQPPESKDDESIVASGMKDEVKSGRVGFDENGREQKRGEAPEVESEDDKFARMAMNAKYFKNEKTGQIVTVYPAAELNDVKHLVGNMRWVGKDVFVDERSGWIRLRDSQTAEWNYYELLDFDDDGYFRCDQTPCSSQAVDARSVGGSSGKPAKTQSKYVFEKHNTMS